MPKILVVEDEEKIARFVELELNYEGYEVEKAADGRAGLEMAQAGGFDCVLLDIMLPELSGTEVLRRLRKTSPVPVIMLTAKDGVPDKVAGLDLGADDYVTKPFAIEELLARIRAVLRKTSGAAEDAESLSCGAVTLTPARRSVSVSGEAVELTKREFDLLEYLLRNKNTVVLREKLLTDVWDFDFDGGTNAVDVYIRFLRQKIDEKYNIKLIHTVRGVGYTVRDDG